MQTPIDFSLDEHGIALLRVNRPAARNALNWTAQEQFAATVAAVGEDTAVRVLIITGAGDRAFVSGGDLKELAHHPEPAAGERLNRTMSATLSALSRLSVPVIAAVNGDAIGGGCEILSACDLRIATETARFRYAQINNALTTGWGGTARLVRQVGLGRGLELLLTARMLSAVEAQEAGLVHRLVPAGDDVVAAARDWARQLVALPREALAALKQLAYAAAERPSTEVNDLERQLFVELWPRADHLEALAAFNEKRPPRFNQPD